MSIAACCKHARDVSLYPFHAWASPLYFINAVVGILFAFGGLEHGGRSHVADEYISVEGLRLF